MAYQQDSHDEIPDWLKNLPEDSENDSQSNSEMSSEESSSDKSYQEETSSTLDKEEAASDTDWLGDILEESDEEKQQEDKEDTPEWLKNIRDLKTVTGSLSLSDVETNTESSNWLGDLDSLKENEDQPQPEDQDIDDSIDDPATTENEGEEKLDPTKKELSQTPEWLEKIRSQQVVSSSEEIEKQKDPNWLDTIRDKYFEDTQEQEAFTDKSDPEPTEGTSGGRL